MADGASPEPNGPGEQAIPHSKSDCAPVQVVVVQQNPAEDERETVGKFIGGLLNDDKDDRPEGKPPRRQLTLALSPHNLLIIIALFILAGGQVVGVILRLDERRKDETDNERFFTLATQVTSQAPQTAAAAQQAASAAQSTSEAAQQAASTAQSAAATAQQAAVAAEQAEIPKTDPALETALIAAALRNYPTPSTGTVIVQTPTPASATPGPAGTGGTGAVKLPVLPNIHIVPCSDQFQTVISNKTAGGSAGTASGPGLSATQLSPDCDAPINSPPWQDVKFPGPIRLSIRYYNDSKAELMMLDTQAILTTENVGSGTSGVLGICAYPRLAGGWSPWESNNEPYRFDNVVLHLDPFWHRAEREKAKQAWAGGVYLTLCTTFRAADSWPILNRTVFKIAPDDADGPGRLKIPVDDVQNFVLQ